MDIISNGNQPGKVVRHIQKLLPGTSSLALEDTPANPSSRPRAVRFVSSVGNEMFDFEPAVLLEGKASLEGCAVSLTTRVPGCGTVKLVAGVAGMTMTT